MNWAQTLDAYDSELFARGVAVNTRRAYANDLGQLADWAEGRSLAPEKVGYKDLRRFAAHLSQQGAAKATVARKLAAIRGLFESMMRADRIGQNPADLLSAPKQAQKLPRVLNHEEIQALLERIPAHTPLELRDRAMFELAYSCGLRSEEVTTLNVSSFEFDAEQLRIEGKGSRTRIVPVGEHAQRAVIRYLETGRHKLDTGRGEQALFLSKSGKRLSPSDVSRRLT